MSSGQIVFDADYSAAALDACAEEGLLGNALSRQDMGILFRRPATRRLRQVALNIMVMHGDVLVTGAPRFAQLDLSRVVNEGVVHSIYLQGGTETDFEPEDGFTVLTLLPWVLPAVMRDLPRKLKELGLPTANPEAIEAAFHAIARARDQGLSLFELRDCLRRLGTALNLQGPDSFFGQEGGPAYEVVAWTVAKLIAGEELRLSASPSSLRAIWTGTIGGLVLIERILEHHEALGLSTDSRPLLVNERRSSRWPGSKFARMFTKEMIGSSGIGGTEAAGAFSNCQLAMHEVLRYAPVVDTVQDVIRLREREEIDRFREVLFAWLTATEKGQANSGSLLNEVRAANEEFQRLSKWRRIERWIYRATLPTVLVPIIGQVIGTAGVITRWHIETKEKRHGWILLGK